MLDPVAGIAASPLYIVALAFFAYYPLLSALMWVATSLVYWFRRERHPDESFYDVPVDELPMVSVVVPSYSEELTVCGTMTAILELDYPRYEIVLVNDGSGDQTLKRARSFLADERVRVVDKVINEGKALALNDVMPLLRGELMLVIDGDSAPRADVLRWMVPHFVRNPRLGAVTGNPRVRDHHTLLARIQAVEFSSIVSLLKRAQVVWGRVMTVSGVLSLYRVSAIEDVGMFVHDAATEDISTSWKLQRRHWDIRYEPRALIDMQVPPTVRSLWRQRFRWAKGLAQVLRRNAAVLGSWEQRRLWPVYAEACMSILWAYCFITLTAMWLVTWALGAPLLGATPVPSWWGMVIGTASLVQLAVGVMLDSRYDPSVRNMYFWAALYPVIYWVQMSVITVLATPVGLLHPHGSGRWHTQRAAPDPQPQPD
jgi:biofilm PGA synthesis N-glycosyltransferase PgaC